MGRRGLINQDDAREVIDYVKRMKGRPENTLPQRARWPIATGGGGNPIDWVRVSSTTLNAQGFYPGFVQAYDPTKTPPAAWSDTTTAVNITGRNNETLALDRYLGENFGVNSSNSNPVYVIVDAGLTVEYDDGSNVIANVLTELFSKLDFVLSSPAGGQAKIQTNGLTGTFTATVVTGATGVIDPIACTINVSVTTKTLSVVVQDGLIQSWTFN